MFLETEIFGGRRERGVEKKLIKKNFLLYDKYENLVNKPSFFLFIKIGRPFLDKNRVFF